MSWLNFCSRGQWWDGSQNLHLSFYHLFNNRFYHKEKKSLEGYSFFFYACNYKHKTTNLLPIYHINLMPSCACDVTARTRSFYFTSSQKIPLSTLCENLSLILSHKQLLSKLDLSMNLIFLANKGIYSNIIYIPIKLSFFLTLILKTYFFFFENYQNKLVNILNHEYASDFMKIN